MPIALPQLQEYVDDAEDYINIMLDEKQNQLLQVGRPANDGDRGGQVVTAGIVVVSLFGMNIRRRMRRRGSGT